MKKQKYIQNVDSDYGFEIAKKLTTFKTNSFGFRLAGTQAEKEAGEWICSEMKNIGLENVTMESLPVDAWEFKGASLTVMSPDSETKTLRAGSFPCIPGTDDNGVTAELVYVGVGTKENYEELDVEGKIVLVDTDSYHTYWYNTLFDQAEARGAVAVVATVVGTGPGTYTDDLITVHELSGSVGIPRLMLTKGDGDALRERVKSGEAITVTVKADITITPGAEAHYVYGMIPGRNPDRYIIVGGHYDAYWDGFQDNASSLGTTLTMAKAMIDSGYKPESTFVFLSNGAEEYGNANSCFGFCAGSSAIVKQHPEWVEGAVIYNNYELSAIDQTEDLEILTPPGNAKITERICEELDLDKEVKLINLAGIGADDGIFSKAGMPTYMKICTHFADDPGQMMAEEDPESVQNYDHTEHDNVDLYDAEVFDSNNKIHGLINMAFDDMAIVPLEFSKTAEELTAELDAEMIKSIYPRYTDYLAEINCLIDNSAAIYEKTESINSKVIELKNKKIEIDDIMDKAWEQYKMLLSANRLIQQEIYKFGAFSDVIIGHNQPWYFVTAIDSMIAELETGKVEKSMEAVVELGNNYMVFDFDKEVYEKIAIRAFEEAKPQTWGYKQTIKFPDMYDAIESVAMKLEDENADFSEDIRVLENIKENQKNILIETLEREHRVLGNVNEILEGMELDAVLDLIEKEN